MAATFLRTLSALAALAGAGGLQPAAAQTESQNGDSRGYQLQIGSDYFWPGNLDDPFLDLTKAGSGYWRIERPDEPPMAYGEAVAAGFINVETGLPSSLPPGASAARGPGFLTNARHYPNYYAGAYTFEWEGDAFGFIHNQPRDLQRRIGKNRLSFFVRPENVGARAVGFSRIRGEGIASFRVYRDEHKERIEAGEIWNPAFIENVRKYDIFRTMNLQRVNNLPVRSFDEVARPEDSSYVNALRNQWPAPARYGMPYEVLFDLAMEADVDLWVHIPPMIGAPEHPAKPSFRNDKDEVAPAKLDQMARTAWRDILDSPEWDAFAAAFAERLIASGYPADRPLYIEIGNEVWNFAYPFSLHTSYLHGLAAGMNASWGHREAYGALTAHWAAALERELDRRGVSYNVTYVLASQTATHYTTVSALRGMKRQLELSGADAERILSKTGVALTSYVSCFIPFSKRMFPGLDGAALRRAWEKAIDEDREGLMRRHHDFCLNGPANAVATRAWVMRNWRAHRRAAASAGVRIIGAYEGGSHDEPPGDVRKSEKFKRWWTDYHWGPYGADVVRQVNLAIVEEFPGVILSNYAGMGGIGAAPWLDGHYALETDMLRMWDEFARPQTDQQADK